MRFHFTTFNHVREGRIIIEDMAEIMRRQMRALGHEMSYAPADPRLRADAINVIVESFADDPVTIARMAEAHGFGAKIVILATEEPTAKGFNYGLDPAMIERQRAFPEAAKHCDGILHLMPGDDVTAWYAKHAPAAHYELGWGPPLFEDPDDVEPDHDFGFYGKMTWRREEVLERLGEFGKVLRITSLDVPRLERDRMMRRAKVIVQVRANEEWGMVSSTRCATALMFGRPVIAEPHPDPSPWERVVTFARSLDEFYETAAAATRLWRWRHLHDIQHRKFVAELPPSLCLGEPLRRIGFT